MTRVHIELQRVQTWLFAVPRLRAMVGANSLLGEVLRVQLPELARQGATAWSLSPTTGPYPGADPDDPLQAHDDPAADASNGILARDGGHFEAIFASGAAAFADEAATLLRRELPGLRFRVRVGEEERRRSHAALSTELPVLAPCEWTGRGVAGIQVRQGTERARVALDVSRRHEAARRAEAGEARDLASLLTARTALADLSRPMMFQSLTGDGYLALIHADGNGVGAGAPAGDDAARASFYLQNRVFLRRALRVAIGEVCHDQQVAPLCLLMLGGDDVLIVCRAAIALPFVVSLCKALAQLQEDRSGFRLALGVGVAVAKPTIPIHRMHEVAERLAASAKRRARGLSPEQRSVVDWAVYTASWVDDPEDLRRRDWVRGATGDVRILSRRPLDVLGSGLDSLQGLLQGASRLQGAPRSQLRHLVGELPRGRVLSELAFDELSQPAREAFDRAGVTSVWTEHDGGPRTTSVLDLVEVFEIGRLGRAAPPEVGPPAEYFEEETTASEEDEHARA